MPVGLLTLHLLLPGCTSLKEKRGRLKPLIFHLHRVYNLSVAEMDRLDQWQEVVMVCALVGNDSSYIQRVLDLAVNDIQNKGSSIEVLENHLEMI